jgi:GWxTD domain-containing protein
MGAQRASAVLGLALVAGLAAAAPPAQPLKAWRDGPVRVLLDRTEYERFGALRTEEDRQAFIDEFWHRMDEGPAGASGNFRATFEARVAIANERFRTNVWQEGWSTSRGRVFIVLGEPTAIRQETAGTKALAKEVWIYNAPGEPQATIELAFYRCADGTYRTEPSCETRVDTTSVTYDWQRWNYLRDLRLTNPDLSAVRVQQLLNEFLNTLPRTYSRRPPSATRGSTSPQPPPPPHADARDHANGLLDVVPYYFRAQDGSVLTFITMRAVDDAAPAGAPSEGTYLAAASFEEADKRGARVPGASPRTTLLEPVARPGKSPMFFGRAYLDSGNTYAARYALKDDAKGEVVVKDVLLTVPDLDGFATSSLVPAERFGPVKNGTGPFQVGSEEIVPKPDASFRRSELLRLYVQVYGAAIDPERQAPRVDVAFRFQQMVKGEPKKFGKPFSVREAAGGAMGLALPIGDWPPGEYRVSVELRDRVSGERLIVPGAFTIRED